MDITFAPWCACFSGLDNQDDSVFLIWLKHEDLLETPDDSAFLQSLRFSCARISGVYPPLALTEAHITEEDNAPRGLVPRYPLQKPPSRGLEGYGEGGGGERRSEGRRGLHLWKASRGLQGFKGAWRGLEGGLKGASKGLEGGFTFGRLQGGLKGASRGLQGGLKGAWSLPKVKRASRGLKGAWSGLQGGFTFGRLQGGLKGASRGLQGGLKGAWRGLEGGFEGGFEGAWRGLKGAWRGLERGCLQRWSGLRGRLQGGFTSEVWACVKQVPKQSIPKHFEHELH